METTIQLSMLLLGVTALFLVSMAVLLNKVSASGYYEIYIEEIN